MLNPVAEKLLLEKCDVQRVAYCPTMDLIALATNKQNVHVYRFNGQRVFGASFESSEVQVACLAWKPNGQLLAIACSDGTIKLLNSFSGKAVHHLSSFKEDAQGTPFLSWGVNLANPLATQQRLSGNDSSFSLEDLIGRNAQLASALTSIPDLPKELILIDVETSLLKLSTLPPTGGDDDVFSTRTSIDAIFHSSQNKNMTDVVDVLLSGFDSGSLHLGIYDSFEIGNISLASSLPQNASSHQVVCHASHPLISSHVIAVESKFSRLSEKPTLRLLSLDLNFIHLTAPYSLPVLATKATQLQNLLRYLSQIENQIAHEVRSAFDLPSRFLGNINEALAEQVADADFVTSAYHLILTGECIPSLKEWLVDEVGERGVKRWEKSVSDCLEMVRRSVHECIVPALERCQIVISRLDGLSKFQKSAEVLGLDERQLKYVRDTLDCLGLLSHDLLRVVGREIKEFENFIRWMKFEVEVESLEDTSERAEELREGSDSIEYQTVLDYVSGAMQGTKILDHVRITSDAQAPSTTGWARGIDGAQFFDEYKKRKRSGSHPLPKLDELISRLKEQCGRVFAQIAETLRKSILHSHLMDLPKDCDSSVMDARIVGSGSTTSHLYIACRNNTADKIILMELCGTARGTRVHFASKSVRELALPALYGAPVEFFDVKFVNDDSFMVLAFASRRAHLFVHRVGLGEETGSLWELWHAFGKKERPAKIEVNGRKGRRAVCVLDEGGLKYTVLDLDSPPLAEDQAGDEEMTG